MKFFDRRKEDELLEENIQQQTHPCLHLQTTTGHVVVWRCKHLPNCSRTIEQHCINVSTPHPQKALGAHLPPPYKQQYIANKQKQGGKSQTGNPLPRPILITKVRRLAGELHLVPVNVDLYDAGIYQLTSLTGQQGT